MRANSVNRMPASHHRTRRIVADRRWRVVSSGVRLLIVPGLMALLTCSCGGGTPAEPTAPVRVSGVWVGHSTLATVSGGACVGDLLRGRIGARDLFAAQLVQSANDLEAGVTYQGNKIACEFSGSAQGVDVQLTLRSCRVGQVLSLDCGGGELREIEMRSRRIVARADNGTGTGSDTSTWDVRIPGSTAAVGTLSLTATFTWNVLRLPPSDFHVFDGSILPGYVDGTVTIPAEAEPFCV